MTMLRTIRTLPLLLATIIATVLIALPPSLYAQVDTSRLNEPRSGGRGMPDSTTLVRPAIPSDTLTTPLGTGRGNGFTANQVTPVHADSMVNPIYPQEEKRIIRFGLFGGAGYSMQDAQLGFPGVQLLGGGECQCSFTSGVGIGAGGALGFSMSFDNDRWSQGLRLSMVNNTARSIRHDSTYFFQPGGLPPKLDVTEEQFDLSNNSLGLELLFTYRLPLLSDLFIIAGPSINLLVSNNYSVTLVDENSTTKPVSGTIDNTENVYTSLIGGLGARLPLGGSNVALQPEALFIYPLDRISRKYSWSFMSVRANLGLIFTL